MTTPSTDALKIEFDIFRQVPTAFWLEDSAHEYVQRPVLFHIAGACINCGERPCGWNCESYYNKNGYTIASGEMVRLED